VLVFGFEKHNRHGAHPSFDLFIILSLFDTLENIFFSRGKAALAEIQRQSCR
jgi:hypothetical protein